MMNQYQVVQKSRNVLLVSFTDIAAGWEQWLQLSSDRHHDSVRCLRGLETQHLRLAAQREALIIDSGDLFCAMQSKHDRRTDPIEIRPEDVGRNYLDLIVQHAAEDYAPYVENFLLLGLGNHETAVLKHNNTSLTSNLVHRLNGSGGRCYTGGYGGWVKFQFTFNKTKRQSVNLKYFHGAGGDAPVSRGVLKTARQAVYLPDADIVVNGHNHNAYHVPIARERLTQRGDLIRDMVDYVRVPGYHDGYGDGADGWTVETEKPIKPCGCAWVRFWFDPSVNRIEREVVLSCK